MRVVIEEDVVPGGPLNLNFTNLPRPWSRRESSSSGKIPTVETGIEPGTSSLVARDSDHQTTKLVNMYFKAIILLYMTVLSLNCLVAEGARISDSL